MAHLPACSLKAFPRPGKCWIEVEFSPSATLKGWRMPLTWQELKRSKPPPGPAELIFSTLSTDPYNKLSSGDSPPRCDGITAPHFMIIHFCFCCLSLPCSQWHFQHLGILKKPQEPWNSLSRKEPTRIAESNSWLLRTPQESHSVPGSTD